MNDVVTGFLVGGALMGLLVYQRSTRWSKRAAQLSRAMASRGDALQVYMLAAGGGLETELATIAQQAADTVARRTADEYLASRFGLTPSRLASLQRLQERFG